MMSNMQTRWFAVPAASTLLLVLACNADTYTGPEGLDAGGTGAGGGGTGGGSAVPAPILSKACPGESNDLGTDPKTIVCSDGGDFELEVTANGTDTYLFILNVPETWLNSDGTGIFLVSDVDQDGDEALIASGYYTARTGQRVPVNLVGTRKLSEGTHTIRARWASSSAGSLRLGTSGARLVAVPATEQDLQAVHGPAEPKQHSAFTWQNIDVSYAPPIEIKQAAQAGDYLIILNAPATYGDGADTTAELAIVVDRNGAGTDMVAYGKYETGFSGQRVPFTMFGQANLAAGDRVRAEWRAPEETIHIDQADDTINATWLVALRMPEHSWSSHYSGAELATTNAAPVDIGMDHLDFTSKGGNHLFILNVPVTWSNAVSSNAASFHIGINGTWELMGVYSSVADPSQHIPMTIVGVKDLPAGQQYNVSAGWAVQGGYALKMLNGSLFAMSR